MIKDILMSTIEETLMEKTKMSEKVAQSLAEDIAEAIFDTGLIQDEDETFESKETEDDLEDSYREFYDNDDFEGFE